MQDFAQELIDSVIDLLHNDKVALKSCSLVCRSWEGPAHFHLFSSVTVTIGRSEEEWRSLPAFADFLDVSQTLRANIRDLKVEYDMNGGQDGQGLVPVVGSKILITPNDIARVLEKLLKLRSLSFKHLLLGTYSADSSHPSQQFRLEHLTIEDCHGPDWGIFPEPMGQNLLDFLGLFIEINHLRLHRPAEHVGGAPNDTTGEVRDRVPVDISSLSLLFPKQGVPPLVDTVAKGLSFSKLTSFTASCTHEDDVAAVGNILKKTGSTLLHLDFNLGQLDYDALLRQLQEPLVISPCTNLEHFVFRLAIEGYDGNYQQIAWEVTLRILSSVASSLRTLTFLTFISDPSALDELEIHYWNQFREILNRFPRLESLAFTSPTEEEGVRTEERTRLERENVRNFAQNMLPSLVARGVIRV